MNIKSFFLGFLSLLFLITAKPASAQQSQSSFIKHGENLYVLGIPNTYNKLHIYGVRKIKTIKTNSCGALILPTDINDESAPIDIKDDAGFSLSVNMDDFYDFPEKALSSCVNGIFQEPESGLFWANNLNSRYLIPVAIIQPNKVYFVAYAGLIVKNIKFNSCGFAKIKKPNYSIDNPYFAMGKGRLENWSDIKEKRPDLCLNNQKYVPYN
jgi:hypothetical protein